MSLALAIATFVAAIGLTYWCCVRPMRRDRSRHAPGQDAADATATSPAAGQAPDMTRPPTPAQRGDTTAIRSGSRPRQDG